MREIDDRYPEFAEPNEPVKRGKHHKGLTWSFPALAGVFILTLALINSRGGSSNVPPPGAPEPPEGQEPRIVTVAISVESEEETYSGKELEITPRFDYTAEEEGSDVTDLVSVELKEGTVVKATDAGEYPFDLTSDSFSIKAEGFDKCEVVVNDGTLKILPAELVVAITGNTVSESYDKNPHSVTGYSVTSGRDDYKDSDISFSGNASASRTAVGTTYMGLTPEQFTNKNDNFIVEFDVTDGYIEVNRAAVNVSITGSSGSAVYDRNPHGVSGYTVSSSRNDYTASDFSFSGSASASRTTAGTSYMGLSSGQFTNRNDNYSVTFNVTDGYIEVRKADVNVTITGSTESSVYDGEAHTVGGYRTSIDNSNYTQNSFTFTGSAFAFRTEVGITYMGLNSSQFRNLDDNFNVRFNVTDGYVEITQPEIIGPTVTGPEVQDNVNLDLIMFARVTAKIKPGEELSKNGGIVDAWVYVKSDTANTFDRDTEYPFHYEFDGDDSELEIEIVHRMPEDLEFVRQTGKLVVQYTYPDGTTGSYESEEFYMYKGSFAEMNKDYGEDGLLLSGGKLEADLIIHRDMTFENGGSLTVLPENVVLRYGYASLVVYDGDNNYVEDMSKEKEMPDETELYTDSDGLTHMHLTYYFPEDAIPASPYSVKLFFNGIITDNASGWDSWL